MVVLPCSREGLRIVMVWFSFEQVRGREVLPNDLAYDLADDLADDLAVYLPGTNTQTPLC